MMTSIRGRAAFTLFLAMAMRVGAEDAPAPPAVDAPAVPAPAGDYYGSALQAYLAGEFDQAILLDSKALQADPKDAKAQALLSLLVNEKDKANHSVIWIGHNSIQEAAPVAPAPLPQPVTVVQESVVQGPAGRPRPAADPKGLAQLEARVSTLAFLLERDSNSQYRELTGAQLVVNQRLDEFGSALRDIRQSARWSNLLFLLALVLSSIALYKSWRNGQELRRRSPRAGQGNDKEDRVVQIRRM